MAVDRCRMIDSEYFTVGDSDDGKWYHTGTATVLLNDTGHFWIQSNGGELKLDNNSHGSDTVFTNENAGGVNKTLLTLDPDRETTKITGFEGTSVTVSGDTDNQDVLGVSIIKVDSNGGNIVIGGLANGVTDQIIFLYKNDSANTVTIEHNEGTGTQKIFTADTNDISLANYGGITIVFDGTQWIEIGH